MTVSHPPPPGPAATQVVAATGSSMRICVFGDVQGWTQRLIDALIALGADVDHGVLPDDLLVVQLGDLVHKGPDSKGALELVNRFLVGSPDRWLQLVGNHEAVYLGGAPFWRDLAAPALARVLTRWSDAEQLQVAVALQTAEIGDVLVTHAGLTRWKWETLGRPNAIEAASLLNDEWRRDPQRALADGTMLWGSPSPHVGVVWAAEPLPFSQVHGHTSCFRWGPDRWRRDVPDRMRAVATIDRQRRHERFDWPGGAIIGVDPGFTAKNAAVPLGPLVLTAARP